MLLRRALPAILAAMASVASAATDEREQELVRATAQRDALAARRAALAGEARIAADRLPAGAPARDLRAFDRLARGLDDVERRLAEQERRRARARAAFDEAADAEERRLQERARREGAAAVAAEMASLTAARRRVAQSEAERGFRPPLEVALDPLDGPADVEAKLAVLASEEQRVRRRVEERAAEAALVAARLLARREWARELGLARRDAGGAVDLLDVGAEDARLSLKALEAQDEAVARERAELAAALARLASARTQAEKRLAELRKGR